MTQVDSLRIYFVLPSDDAKEGFSPDMRMCSQVVSKYGGYVEWIKPSQCLTHDPLEKDVFVFEKFEGEAFEALRLNSSKYVVLGVRCLLTCITNRRPIPPNPHPVFTEGMRDLVVTSSGFDPATKKQIQEKVQFMSGCYDNSLRSIITHLVAHNNISPKAVYAYKSNIKIMKLSWVEDVWQQSLVNNVNGSDEIFNKHLSPLFHNLNITTSGLPKQEKKNLKNVIECNGGNFMGTLQGNVTNVVVLSKPEGEKYKFARSWNITCVRPDWVYDCVDAKAILPLKSYDVKSGKPKASTPNKENCTVNFSANFTTNLSAINVESKVLTQLEETATTMATTNMLKSQEEPVKNSKSHLHVINNTLLKNLKDTGLFLDGLNIYLYGFHPEETEKLKRILNKGGAVWFNELTESVTHIIAGKIDDKLSSLTKHGAYVLSMDWLVESMRLKCKANEAKFLLVSKTASASEPPSPMSKQGAQLLSQTEGKVPQFSLVEKNDKLSQIDELLYRYNSSQPGEPLGRPEPAPTCTNKSDSSKTCNYTTDEFFAGLTFFLSIDLSEEEMKYLEDSIKERKGQIVGKRDLGVPDFAIVPVIGASLTEVTAKEVVNIYFIKDCCIENGLLTPRYYHQPVAFVKNARPLKNCVISVSNYVQGEREFMELMIEALGGIAQSLLARKSKQGALKSTHLVCAEAQGQKYEGAVRWGLPVVHHDWLLKCAALGVRVSEKPYLVGDSKIAFEVSVPPTSSMNETEMEKRPEVAKPPHNTIARLKAAETPKTNSPDPNRTITPTSPYGAFYGKGSPTPGTRKRIWKWMNQGADFPLDPPSKPLQEEDSTPVSELISRHLEMLKRKPEELPADSPIAPKRLNMEEAEDERQAACVANGLEKMRRIEEEIAKNGVRSPPIKKTETPEAQKMLVVTESQPHTEVGWEDPVEKEVALETLTKVATHKPKVFIFSCIVDQAEVKQLVEECGGVVSQVPHFDKNATHVIAGSLTRAEKLMAGIAAGLWILHPSYIEALKEQKNVYAVAEEDYEWGGPKQKFRLNSVSANAKEFANCSYLWRVAIGNGETPPFKDMKMLLHLSTGKLESFERVIKAGGGVIVKGTPPHYHGTDANLCVYETNSTRPINFSSLAEQKVLCVALVYISDVILKKKNAVEKNLVPEFVKHWNK